jgi:acetyl esterase/lipase
MRFGHGRKIGSTRPSSIGADGSSNVGIMARYSRMALLLPLLWAGCIGSVDDAMRYSVTESIRYTGALDSGDERVGDLYRPKGEGPWPAVLIVHGGSWQRGSRSEMTRFAHRFAEAGYVVLNIDYRLAPQHHHPAQRDDVRAAFSWLHAHAGPLRVDPDRIAVMGYSAGAHLALLLGLADAHGAPRPRAVIAGGAPCDLTEYPDSPTLAALIGGSGRDLPDRYVDASPIAHVTSDDPPVLLYHGSLDWIVDVEQSRRLLAALHAAGVSAELFEEPWAGHGTAFLLDGDSFRASLDFLAEQMRR